MHPASAGVPVSSPESFSGLRERKHIAPSTPTTNIQHPAKCQSMGVIPPGLPTNRRESGVYKTQLEAMD